MAMLTSATGSANGLRLVRARFPCALVRGGEGNCCALISTTAVVAAACPLLLRVMRFVGAGVAAIRG